MSNADDAEPCPGCGSRRRFPGRIDAVDQVSQGTPRSEHQPERQQHQPECDQRSRDGVGNGQREQTAGRNILSGRYDDIGKWLGTGVDQGPGARLSGMGAAGLFEVL